MTKACGFQWPRWFLRPATTASGQSTGGPETVVVHNGPITLLALLWRPPGRGPFPAILLNHGSGNENLICGR